MRLALSMLVVSSLSAACASQPRSPFFGDEKYLRFGVDPRTEADALVQAYAQQSEHVAQRIIGRDFTAIGLMDRAGLPTRARVVTMRGITLALDPQPGTPLQAAVRYALLAPPLTQTQDADGDGFEEVFIEQRTAGQNPCLLVYRVRDVGYVDRLNTSLRAFGREHCSSGVADVDQDGKAELLVDIEFVEFELPTAPTLRLLLWPERHSYSARGTGEQLARFIAAQQAARELDLESARADEDTATALRLAVELAALTQALGLPSQDQLARFDSALRDFALSPAEQSRAQTARQQIEQAWKEAPKLSGPEPAQRDASEAGPPSTGLAERHAS